MIHSVDPDNTRITGAVQTMLTWTKVLSSKEEIPSAYIPLFDGLTAHCRSFPYTLLAPPMKNRWYKPAERLLLCMDEQLIVLQKRNKLIHQQSIPLNPAIDLEMGNSLLFSWITLRDFSQDGITQKITLTFNAATARHYEPLIQKIRPVLEKDQTRPRQTLCNADFKFNHFAKESLLPGVRIIDSIWQPVFFTPVISFLGKPVIQNKRLAHMAILTENELILLWDDERSLENRGVRYGGVRRFIPIPKIKTGSLIEVDHKVCHFQLQLSDDSQIMRTFCIENQETVQSFSQCLAVLISAQGNLPS
jgi:hypothetical protein